MVKLKHSKFKNTGFIYEILIRNISIDILQNKTDPPSFKILKKFFKCGTQLNQQLLLYNVLLNNKMQNMQQAQMLVTETLHLYKTLDKNILNTEKYNLIQQIKKYYSLQDLFKTKIEQYKTLASIYKIFESVSTRQSYNPLDIVNSKQLVLEYITNNTVIVQQKDQIVENFCNQDEDTQILAYKLIIERFNKKYDIAFNQQQKQLLRKYIHSFSNFGVLRQHIQLIVPILQEKIKQKLVSIDDSVIHIKLQQVLNQLNTIPHNNLIKQSHIIALLKTYCLIDELQKQVQ